jgi:Flp pilus assembly protein TadG
VTLLERAPRRRREARDGREPQKGQAIVLFALLLVAVLGAAGLLVDGGMAWANRQAAQNAADLAALAAAKAVTTAGATCNAAGQAIAQAAATSVATMNGFTSATVQYPATSGSHTGCLYLRVHVQRTMNTTFSRIMGQTTWTPAADATASMLQTQGAATANCTFCSLNTTNKNHTLLVQVGSTLQVDGEIYVNSSNGLNANDPNSPIKLQNWNVGGDAFDIFGTGGKITATKISVVGGWETHDNGVATAAQATCPAAQHPDPPGYSTLVPKPVSNVCIHQPVLADPLANYPSPSTSSYTTQATKQLNLAGNSAYTLQPGVYIGGIKIQGNASVTLVAGMYLMYGGGFSVSANASINGTGVTIYSSSTMVNKRVTAAGDISINTTGTVTLTPPTTGSWSGMTLYMDRTSAGAITIDPTSTTQCASANGCIGGIAGTIYAANQDSLVTVSASGTANLQVLSGKMLITNGGTAHFTFNSAGFANSVTTITLVE